MGGAATTLSSLGAFGVDRFTAMVNPGESTIVAVGRTIEQAVPRGRRIAVVPTLTSRSASTTASSTARPAPPRWPSSPTCSKGAWRGGP